MPLQPFDQICPEIACKELRICTVPATQTSVPADDYFLREFYCNELGCDCRRVLVQFMPAREDGEIAASINFGWERPRFYRKWSSDPDLWREMAGATLEPFAEQGPYSSHFLAIFEHCIKDPALVALFRRHYFLAKQALAPPSWVRP